jgi:hypothetical protein
MIIELKNILTTSKNTLLLAMVWRNPNKRYELVANGSHGKLTIYKSKR